MNRVYLTALFLIFSVGLYAQPNAPHAGRRSGLGEMQCNQIIIALGLEGDKSDAFREIYMASIEAQKQPKHEPIDRVSVREEGGVSEEELEQRTLSSFDRSIKAMELKKEYYTKFRTILTPSEIVKMYETERRIRDHAIEELRRRGGGGEAKRGGGQFIPPHVD